MTPPVNAKKIKERPESTSKPDINPIICKFLPNLLPLIVFINFDIRRPSA
jgi:hypothetical protein